MGPFYCFSDLHTGLSSKLLLVGKMQLAKQVDRFSLANTRRWYSTSQGAGIGGFPSVWVLAVALDFDTLACVSFAFS